MDVTYQFIVLKKAAPETFWSQTHVKTSIDSGKYFIFDSPSHFCFRPVVSVFVTRESAMKFFIAKSTVVSEKGKARSERPS